MNEAIRMQLSAFIDGELPENEAELLLRRLSQDTELRQQVAEFMAIGRAIRGEVQISGIGDLRDRISGALDAAPAMDEFVEGKSADSRFVRPLLGFAIAASVALVAIFGLRQMSGVEGVDAQAPQLAGGAGYTQQQPEDVLDDELLRQMRNAHDASTSDQRFDTRLTSVGIIEELAGEESDEKESVDETVPDETPADDTAVE